MAIQHKRLPDHPEETFAAVSPGAARASHPTGHDDETQSFAVGSERPPPQPSPASQGSEPAPAGVRYRMLRRIAEGGMGEVWEAEQASLGRVIAVKRLKQRNVEADDEFRAESFIAANLEHPNILPVYDLGQERDGGLLLAMKRVHGRSWKELLKAGFEDTPVDDYLARHVPILVSVAQAVAFAHARGVIHRDIKPAQVLVGEYGEVLLTDWGLAVQTDGKVARHAAPAAGIPTPASATSPAGTPALMAPEQTENHGGNLGPWTDIYLLGGTLYYLLTGAYPHGASSSTKAFEQAREGLVVPPSERAGGRQVPAEIERLCLAALQPKPAERLPSAEAFVQGLQDYLSGAARKTRSLERVTAIERQLAEGIADYAGFNAALAAVGEAQRLWPDNPALPGLRQAALLGSARLALQQGDLAYARVQGDALPDDDTALRLRQEIAQRQRASTRRRTLLRAATAGVVLLLMVIAAGALRFSQQMRAANAEIERRAQEAELARSIATERGDRAFELIDFVLRDLKTAMDEELTVERGITMDVRNAIAHAIAGKVAGPVLGYFGSGEAPAQWPQAMRLGHATQMLNAGNRFWHLARREEAERLFVSALALRERLLGNDSVEVAEVLRSLAAVRREEGRFEEALDLASRAVGIVESEAGADDPALVPYLLQLAQVHGASRSDRERLAQAEATLRRAVAILEDEGGPELSQALMELGNTLRYLDRPADAIPLLRRALEHEQSPDSLASARVQRSLGAALRELNRSARTADRTELAEAEDLLQAASATLARRLGPQHPETGDARSALATVVGTLGRHDESEAIERDVLDIYRAAYGAEHFRTARKQMALGFVLYDRGKLRESEQALREAQRILSASLGADSLEVGWTLQFLGFGLHKAGRLAEAREALLGSIEILSARRGPEHLETMKSKEALAEVEAALGRDGAG